MASESTMTQSYPTWIESRWEAFMDYAFTTGVVPTLNANSMIAIVNNAVDRSTPANDVILPYIINAGLFNSSSLILDLGSNKLLGTVQSGGDPQTHLKNLHDLDVDALYASAMLFEMPPEDGMATTTAENNLLQQWYEYGDPAKLQAYIDAVVAAFVAQAKVDLEDQIFPAAQSHFIVSNNVFSSTYARHILDSYRKVGVDADKLSADLRLQSYDRNIGAVVEMAKVVAQRRQNTINSQQDNVVKRVTLKLQKEELDAKMAQTVRSETLKAMMEVNKMDFMVRVARERWELDNLKTIAELMASLHGASPTSASSSTEGWNAMSGWEQGMTVAGTIISGVAAISELWGD